MPVSPSDRSPASVPKCLTDFHRFCLQGSAMVTLREITKDNYEECLSLSVAENQKGFVSSTAYSLAQAWVYRDTDYPFAVYADETMVGFVMLGYYELKEQYTLWKIMIDKEHQNRGYGREALRLGIRFPVDSFGAKEIYTAYESSNSVARDLYRSFGFRETGEVAGNDVEMRLVLDGAHES